MKKTCVSMAVASALSFLGHTAYAGDPVIVLGDIPVTAQGGGALMSNNILTSVDVLAGEQVQDKNVMNSWELLGQMPGIQLTETRMGAESGKVTFRAFNGEGYINGIKVLIDGIPSNVNSGNQRFIDMIFPLEIDYIEVVRGTNDPRYGLHNIGGNINLGTRQGGNYLDSRLSYGSFNTREAQVVMGHEKDGFSQNYFFAKQDSDGYRDHSDSEKYSAGAKWFLSSASGDLKAGLVARAYTHKAEEAGFLTATELAANRRQSPGKNANDGDDRDMGHISAHVDWQITPATFLSNKFYFNTYQDDRRVTFTSYAVGNAPRQRRIWDEDQLGYLGTLTWNASEKVVLESGLNVERQDNHYQRMRYNFASPTDFTTPAVVQNDDDYSLNNVGAYVQAIVKPTDSLKIVPGFRVDRFTGSTRLQTGETAPLQDYGWINQPKLSVVYSPKQDVSLYANWGRTFQVLTGSTAPAYLTTGQITYRPSVNTGKELGIKFKPLEQTEMRVAAWQQDATDEVANMPSTGTTVGLGQTRRRGLDFQVNGQATDQLKLWFSHSIQKAEVVSAFSAGGVSLAGKEVFSTPRYITNLGMDYRVSDTWEMGLQGRAQGSYFIDTQNEAGKFGDFMLWDANLRYTVSKNASIDFQIKNLTDHEYEYVWYDSFFWPAGSAQPMYSPGIGRAAFISLNLKM